MNAIIKRLPSGYWSIWVGQTWIDAASTTAEQAVQKAVQECKCLSVTIVR